MARKKKDEIIIEDQPGTYTSNVRDVTVDEYLKPIIIKYGINVSVFRIAPSILDGLTPVSRRTIYSMFKEGVTYDKPRKKVSELTGRVAAYHPHGNLSIEKAFKNEIKQYETNACLYDVHGNTGSGTGQGSAAIRYLDARLSKFATYCFFHKDDYCEDLLDMVDTYTRDKKEPLALASRYPYFLLTNTTGIGWGSSFSSIPFNLTEVFRLTQALLRNPDMTNVKLYPDSPRGYDIIDEPGKIEEICDNGQGTMKIQARMDVMEGKDFKYISVTGLPEQTAMDKITEQIAKMIMNKSIYGIKTFKDKCTIDDVTGEETVEFWLILEPDVDVDMVKDTLYRKTQLRHYLSVNFNYADKTNMVHLGLKESLLIWISNRINYKSEIIAKKVYKLHEKIHILEGISTMVNTKNIDRTINIIKNSEDRDDANQRLMKEYGVTSYQANCISDVRLTDLSKKARKSVTEELAKIREDLKETNAILGDTDKIKDIIEAELEEGIKLFGKPRACRVIDADALEPPKYKYNLVVTRKYVKKLSSNSSAVGLIGSDDEIVKVFKNVSEDKTLYLVDDLGKVYAVKLSKLKPTSSSAKGNDLISTIGLKGQVIQAFYTSEEEVNTTWKDVNLVMFTESGIIKQSPLSTYVTSRTEVQGISLNGNDKVCYALIYGPDNYQQSPYILIYTNQGNGIALDMGTIPSTGRDTKGSNFLKLEDNEVVKGVCETTNPKIFVLTTKGMGKVCELDDIFKTSKRRVSMIKITGLGEGDSIFKIIPFNPEGKYVCVLQSGERIDINKSGIKCTTRVSKGFKLVPVKRGDAIIKIKEV